MEKQDREQEFRNGLERLRQPEPAPGGFAGRLARQVDQWNAVEKTALRRARRGSLGWAAAIAASVVLLAATGLYIGNRPAEPADMAAYDTYSDPEDAAVAAERALTKFSKELNKGLDKVGETENERK